MTTTVEPIEQVTKFTIGKYTHVIKAGYSTTDRSSNDTTEAGLIYAIGLTRAQLDNKQQQFPESASHSWACKAVYRRVPTIKWPLIGIPMHTMDLIMQPLSGINVDINAYMPDSDGCKWLAIPAFDTLSTVLANPGKEPSVFYINLFITKQDNGSWKLSVKLRDVAYTESCTNLIDMQ